MIAFSGRKQIRSGQGPPGKTRAVPDNYACLRATRAHSVSGFVDMADARGDWNEQAN